jgi:hypothetical protein
MSVLAGVFALVSFVLIPSIQAQEAASVTNVVVYKEAGRFAGWPANNGIWAWDNEIVVGFSLGYFKYAKFGHAIDEHKPMTIHFARSLDGGATWRIEVPPFLGEGRGEKEATDCPGGIDFTQPNFAMNLRMVSSQEGYSRFYYTTDRWKTCTGPFKLPTFDRKTVSARTDYIVLGKNDLIAFMTAGKDDGAEGRAFCTRTQDGGKTWAFVSWITPEPKGFTIMPSTVQAGPSAFVTAIRCAEKENYWIDLYRTDDAGATWTLLNRPADKMGGNPPSMIRLKDGRIALTYGYREAPFGIRARVSSDDGKTWGDEIVLRKDGGSWDLGYPRTVQRADGKVVTAYYFNDDPEQERYIGATIWTP